ncbi:MAG: asparagine synthase-related protein [Acidobacteriota bacterium]
MKPASASGLPFEDPIRIARETPRSGFALLFRRNGRPAEERGLEASADLLGGTGPDGRGAWSQGPFAAIQHAHWTTDEEIDSVVPFVSPGSGVVILFQGRLDNRPELSASATESDAAVVARAYERWGEAAFERFLGPFALALYEPRDKRLLLARDPLGSRALFCHRRSDLLIAATEELAIIGHPEVEMELDRQRMSQFFAVRELTGRRTFFQGVEQLLPGEILAITGDDEKATRWWPFVPHAAPLRASPRVRAEAFRGTVAEAVRCRLRSRSRTAVSLSGGLDSTALAALAAEIGPPPLAVSWTFDRFPRCDERTYTRPLIAAHSLPFREVLCDDAGPLTELPSWPLHPTTPEQNAYRRFHQRSYAAIADAGLSVQLSGMLGDQLYGGTERWLWELLRSGRFATAARASVGAGGARRLAGAGLPPRVAARLRRRSDAPPWLTAEARRTLPAEPPWPQEAARSRRPTQYLRLLELMNGHGFAVERFFAARHGVEVRYPLHDRRVVELALRLPTEDLRWRGQGRPVIRRALRGRVPDEILNRRDKTSFELVFWDALEQAPTEALLAAEDASWQQWVRADWLDRARRRDRGSAGIVLWTCLCFQLWTARALPSLRAWKRRSISGRQ